MSTTGREAREEPTGRGGRPLAERYKEAGVDIDAKYDAVTAAREAIRATFTPGVLSDIGLFGGLFDPKAVDAGDQVLVASTDSVGTKVRIAIESGRFDTVGQCLVNHCINDILVQGARPLFFLDYIGIGRMDQGVVVGILEGLATACREGGLALLGGETAELPGVYRDRDFDLVGTIVGAVPRDRILDGRKVREGDVICGLPSNGLHTNGYSLARKVLFSEAGYSLDDKPEGLSVPLVDALLAVHRSYLGVVWPLLHSGGGVHACAHITGGGICDNLPRVLPEGLGAEIRKESMEVPALIRLIIEKGGIGEDEAYRVFNMGFGFLLVCDPNEAATILDVLRSRGEPATEVGRVVAGSGVGLV